jgi:hypothetical protein
MSNRQHKQLLFYFILQRCTIIFYLNLYHFNIVYNQFIVYTQHFTRWFKYDRDDLCVNKSQFVPVIFEAPCI